MSTSRDQRHSSRTTSAPAPDALVGSRCPVESWESVYDTIRKQFVGAAESRLETARRRLDELAGPDAPAAAMSDFVDQLHKIAGTAGTYGFHNMSRLALEAEIIGRAAIDRGHMSKQAELARCRTLVGELCDELAIARRETKTPGS